MRTPELLIETLSLEEHLEAFERAWQGAGIPEIADFVPAAGHPDYGQIVLEMVRSDLEFRWRRSARKSLDEYAIEFPGVFADESTLSVLAFEEFRVRRQFGESVTPEFYATEYELDVSEWPDISHPDSQSADGEAADARRLSSSQHADADRLSGFPDPPTEVAGFHLQLELGRGAFSRVYLARQRDLAGRFVVVKLSSQQFLEAEKLAQLQHSCIVPVYSHHEWGGLSAICMPYFGCTTLADVIASVAGARQLPPSGRALVETLANCARRTERVAMSVQVEPADHPQVGARSAAVPGPASTHLPHAASSTDRSSGAVPRSLLPLDGCLQTLSELSWVDAVLRLGVQMADGLQHAHLRGILHNDLKPANVLLADDGRPMLLDFNLAADTSQNTLRGHLQVGGTLPYMSPEKLQAFLGAAAVQDARSDIYAMGAILFELLTGRAPFENRAGTLATVVPLMTADRQQPLPSVRTLNRSVTPAIEAIIHKCLAPLPEHRYQRAEHLQEDLTRQLQRLPLQHQTEPSLRERLQKWTSRHPRLSATISVAGMASLLLLLGGQIVERKRFRSVTTEIAVRVEQGHAALEQDDPALAQGRFLRAWVLAQGEPALQDQLPSFAGWLDHARRATLEHQLKWHIPPREFEVRRDEAFLLCMLPSPDADVRGGAALTALEDALSFASPGDPGWTSEGDLLLLAKADLLADLEGPAEALQFLSGSAISESAEKQSLQRRLQALAAGVPAEHQAEQLRFPVDVEREHLLMGIHLGRHQEFVMALQRFEQVLERQPQQFVPRLLHAVCLARLNRHSEAEVALRACLAQRPGFLWSEYFLSLIQAQSARNTEARKKLDRILEFSPSPALKYAVESALNSTTELRHDDPHETL